MNMQQYLSNPRIFITGPVFGVGVVSLPLHPPPRAQTLQGPCEGPRGALSSPWPGCVPGMASTDPAEDAALQGPWGGVAGAMVCSVNAEMTDLCYFMIAITEMELLLSIMAP